MILTVVVLPFSDASALDKEVTIADRLLAEQCWAVSRARALRDCVDENEKILQEILEMTLDDCALRDDPRRL